MVINMTVKENLTRIIRLEDDIEEVKDRLYNLETNHLELITKLDTIVSVSELQRLSARIDRFLQDIEE